MDNSLTTSGMPMTDKVAEGRRQGVGPALSLYAENGTEEDQTEMLSDQAAKDAENESQQDTDVLHSSPSPPGGPCRKKGQFYTSHADKKEIEGMSDQMGFERSVHKDHQSSPTDGDDRDQIRRQARERKMNHPSKGGYLALRQKNSQTLKNGEQF